LQLVRSEACGDQSRSRASRGSCFDDATCISDAPARVLPCAETVHLVGDRFCTLGGPARASAMATSGSCGSLASRERSAANAIAGSATTAAATRHRPRKPAPDEDVLPQSRAAARPPREPGQGPHPAGPQGRWQQQLARRRQGSSVPCRGLTPALATPHPGPSPNREWMISRDRPITHSGRGSRGRATSTTTPAQGFRGATPRVPNGYISTRAAAPSRPSSTPNCP